jgi:hypothetical protein
MHRHLHTLDTYTPSTCTVCTQGAMQEVYARCHTRHIVFDVHRMQDALDTQCCQWARERRMSSTVACTQDGLVDVFLLIHDLNLIYPEAYICMFFLSTFFSSNIGMSHGTHAGCPRWVCTHSTYSFDVCMHTQTHTTPMRTHTQNALCVCDAYACAECLNAYVTHMHVLNALHCVDMQPRSTHVCTIDMHAGHVDVHPRHMPSTQTQEALHSLDAHAECIVLCRHTTSTQVRTQDKSQHQHVPRMARAASACSQDSSLCVDAQP